MFFSRLPHRRHASSVVVGTALVLGLAGQLPAAHAEDRSPFPGVGAAEGDRYAFHPVDGAGYLLRLPETAGSLPEPVFAEPGARSEPAAEGNPRQGLFAVHPPADPDGAASVLVPLAEAPLTGVPDLFAVGPDGSLYAVHPAEPAAMLVVYRPPAPVVVGAEAEEAAAPAYSTEVHELPTELDPAAMRSSEAGVFLIDAEGVVYRVEEEPDRVRLVVGGDPPPSPEPWRPPESATTPGALPSPPPGSEGAGPDPFPGEQGGGAAVPAHPETAEAPPAVSGPAPRETATGTADQLITAQITRGPLTMSVAGTPVHLDRSGLPGTALNQSAVGELNTAIVTDLRGTNAGWSLVGQSSDFRSGDGGVIDADLLGWTPSAVVLDSDLATALPSEVRPGAHLPPGEGLAVPRTLCAGREGASAGLFGCDAGLELGVPAGAGAGFYAGVLTLTLS
ncbi:hypothetical protein [Nocardiopsis ansamitocini]|uniref:Secreted protein n=1 Tax=Nocardiopsis ansamitocini TaxID=1670832 RepID=A0A9W6PBD2_9ACTN|nr:hypothetical protein [Nocardiopsis ansamitocini]GLU50443.1 hypothetical protein Nans01_47940 [Nocardiopsis ansamitocini]